MAALHPPAKAALHPLQASEGSPCNQPVHPGSGPSDRYVSSPDITGMAARNEKSCSISRIAIGSFLKYHYGFADDVKEYLLTDQPCWHPTKITDALHAAEQNHVCSHYLVV